MMRLSIYRIIVIACLSICIMVPFVSGAETHPPAMVNDSFERTENNISHLQNSFFSQQALNGSILELVQNGSGSGVVVQEIISGSPKVGQNTINLIEWEGVLRIYHRMLPIFLVLLI
jgi:hypothetical protein